MADNALVKGPVPDWIADMFKKNPFSGDNPLADFPNVDGVVALTHKTGCGMTQDEPLALLIRRDLSARHPVADRLAFPVRGDQSQEQVAQSRSLGRGHPLV